MTSEINDILPCCHERRRSSIQTGAEIECPPPRARIDPASDVLEMENRDKIRELQ